MGHRLGAFLRRQHRSRFRVQVAAHQGIGGVEEGEEDSRDDSCREQVRDRHLQNGAHHHEHDARRNEDAQGSPRRDRARRKFDIILRAVHRFGRHDAENRDGRAYNPGGCREDRGDKQYSDEQRPPDAGEHELHGLKQPFHQARLLHEDAHENEQGNGGKGLFQHHRRELEGHQVEDEIAKPDKTENGAEKDECEGDREADEDGEQHDTDHDHAKNFVGHGHLPLVAA